jgi:hypothetical protein
MTTTSASTRACWTSSSIVDQAAQDGFRVDKSAVEVGDGEVAAVVFTVGEVLGDVLVRPGRVVAAPGIRPARERIRG